MPRTKVIVTDSTKIVKSDLLKRKNCIDPYVDYRGGLKSYEDPADHISVKSIRGSIIA